MKRVEKKHEGWEIFPTKKTHNQHQPQFKERERESCERARERERERVRERVWEGWRVFIERGGKKRVQTKQKNIHCLLPKPPLLSLSPFVIDL